MTINGLLISWLAAAASVATERRISDGASAGVIFQPPFDFMLLTLIGGTPARPLDLGPISGRATATYVSSVGKRLGLVSLVFVLSITSLGLGDKKQQMGDDVVPIAGSAITPLLVVTSSMSRGLASLRPQPMGFMASEDGDAEIHRAAHDLFDVDDMARRALGQHWKSLVLRERDEFVRLFGDVLGQFFVTIVERYAGVSVTALDEAVAGTFAQVRSRIVPEQGSEIAIEYRLSQNGSQWMVYDIGLDGLSLVSNYRSQFNSIIMTSSVPHLLERMRTERSLRPQSRDAFGEATSAELETPARARFAAGLLLSLAASYARWR